MIWTMAEWVSDLWKRLFFSKEGIDPNRVLCRQIEERDDEHPHVAPFLVDQWLEDSVDGECCNLATLGQEAALGCQLGILFSDQAD